MTPYKDVIEKQITAPVINCLQSSNPHMDKDREENKLHKIKAKQIKDSKSETKDDLLKCDNCEYKCKKNNAVRKRIKLATLHVTCLDNFCARLE